MKLFYDNKEIHELQEWQKNVIKFNIPASIFDGDMTRRCKYWLESPAEKYIEANKQKIMEELRQKGETTIPTNLVKLGSKMVEKRPELKTKDITRDIPCRVGDQTFELSMDHRKIMREMKKEAYASLDDAAVASEEDKECCERMAWILKDKFNNCMRRLRNEWTQRLAAKGVESVPADDEEFANLVFSQPDYKDREARDAEDESVRQ